MAFFAGLGRAAAKIPQAMEKAALRSVEKSLKDVGRACSGSSKSSHDPFRAMHAKHLDFLKTDIKESISFKSPLQGSLDVARFTFYNSDKISHLPGNEVKFGQDMLDSGEHFTKSREELVKAAHNKIETCVKEGEDLLNKIAKYRGKDKLVKDTHESLGDNSKMGKFAQGEKDLLEETTEDKHKKALIKDIRILIENNCQDVKGLLDQGKELLKKIEKDQIVENLYKEIDQLKNKLEEVSEITKHVYEKDDKPNKHDLGLKDMENPQIRLNRAFEKVRDHLNQHPSEGRGIEKYPYLDVNRQKVIQKPSQPLNVEKSTIRYSQEVKDLVSKSHNGFSSLNSHLDNFNQQLRQFDPEANMVQALMKAYEVNPLLPEDDSTQQNNSSTHIGDIMNGKKDLGDNKGKQSNSHDTGGGSLKGGRKLSREMAMAREMKVES